MSKYVRPLNVSSSNGKRIYAHIVSMGDTCRIEINYLKVVEKDNPSFANNGIIKFQCKKLKYPQVIKSLTKYIEDLFLKGMSNEDVYTSIGAQSKQRGVKTKNTEREIRISKRKRNTSGIPISTRGNEQSESSGEGSTDSKMAESSDSSISREDKTGD